MPHHHADLFPIAERVYLRMQAQDLLRRCLKEQSPDALRNLLDQLLSVEQPDIELMRELLTDINSQHLMLRERRFESRERVIAVFREGYQLDIAGYVPLPNKADYDALTAEGLFEYLTDQIGDLDEDEVLILGEMFAESTQLVASLTRQIEVVKRLMEYLRDWLMALAVEIARESSEATEPSSGDWVQ